MKENFKVKINNDIYDILKEDQMNFNIKNLNTLVNLIFNNYILSGVEDDICENVWGQLKDRKISKENIKVVDEILMNVIYPNTNLKRNDNKAINFRLSGENIGYYDDISTDGSYSDSIFFRKMFEVYARKPKFKREEILYYDLIEKLKKASKGKKNITVYIENNPRFLELHPYSVISSKDESCNYLLSFKPENEKVSPIKISSIEEYRITRKSYSLSKESEQELKERTEKRIITPGKIEKIEIILTSDGYRLYKIAQSNRPSFKFFKNFKIEEKIYYRLYFYTTKSSIKSYFLKFGNKCEIVFPEDLRNDFLKFYKNSFESYKKKKN